MKISGAYLLMFTSCDIFLQSVGIIHFANKIVSYPEKYSLLYFNLTITHQDEDVLL